MSAVLKWVAIAFAAIVAVVVVFGSMPVSEKTLAREAIRSCKSDSQRASFTPAQQVFTAGACETMERRFRERFGVAP